LAETGGMAVVTPNETTVLELPIAGLMTDKPAKHVAARMDELNALVKGQGCPLHAPFMTLSFLALLVIPKLKLSDKGLFDGGTFSFVDVIKTH